jgi:hypothetical protein
MAGNGSKTPRKRPNYVPKKGLFIEIRRTPQQSRVWSNGEIVPNVTKISVEADASNRLAKACIEVVLFEARIDVPEDDTETRHKLIRRRAAWK